MSDSREKDDLDENEVYVHHESGVVSQHFANRKAEIQAAFLLPHLRSGMNLLDCGCGPGSITLGLAEIVAPGQVVGIDIDDKQVKQARALALHRSVSNVRFETCDIYDQHFTDNAFDAVFCSGVLSYLRDPLAALAEIYRVLKSGGVVGIRSTDFDGHLTYPDDPMLLRFWKIYAELIEANGGNPGIGKYQRALMEQSRFINIEASAIYESYGSPEAVRYWGRMVAEAVREENHVTQLTQLGLANASDLAEMGAAWEKWAENPDAFFADAWCEAVGWKA